MSTFQDHIDRISDPYHQNLQSDVEDYDDLLEHEQDYGILIPRQVLLDRQNPLESMRDKTFRYACKIFIEMSLN